MLAQLYLQGKLMLDELVTGTDSFDGIGAAFDAITTGKEARTVLIP
jgi:Zn-dependent alcohol dehydrogenase